MLQPYESNAISVQMGVKRFTHKKWKNGPESCCVEFKLIRNGGMMCRSSRIVGFIACRIIRAGRVTIRKLVGRCRVLIWWGNPGKEYVTQDGGIEKPFASTVGVFSIGK